MNTAHPLIDTLTLNDFVFGLAVTGVDDEIARRRLPGQTRPSMAWNIGHLLHGRARMASSIGASGPALDVSRFGREGATDGHDYPAVADLIAAWRETSAALVPALSAMTDEQLSQAASFPELPHGERTLADGVRFYTWHESYHLGQIGLIRSALGLTPIATLASQAAAAA